MLACRKPVRYEYAQQSDPNGGALSSPGTALTDATRRKHEGPSSTMPKRVKVCKLQIAPLPRNAGPPHECAASRRAVKIGGPDHHRTKHYHGKVWTVALCQGSLLIIGAHPCIPDIPDVLHDVLNLYRPRVKGRTSENACAGGKGEVNRYVMHLSPVEGAPGFGQFKAYTISNTSVHHHSTHLPSCTGCDHRCSRPTRSRLIYAW
jgi:hypothetical protein